VSTKPLAEPGVSSMRWLVRVAKTFKRDERGASLGEYALLLACIAISCLGAVAAAGANINNLMSALASGL
jgi:Flp pilus assembly pilin Flp